MEAIYVKDHMHGAKMNVKHYGKTYSTFHFQKITVITLIVKVMNTS